MDQDQEHLRLLSIFQYIVGGITGFFACFPLIHVAMGVALLNGVFPLPKAPNQPEFPPEAGWIFIIGGGFFILAGWSMAIAMIVAGRSIARRRWYTACLVIAAIECLMMPFGTVLGVFTLIVLLRPSVKAIFQAEAASQAGDANDNPWAQ